MKYDCTKAKDFFHEITRLKEWCRDKSSCGTCGLKPPCPLGCAPLVYDWGGLSDDVFTNLIGILQEWSDSHPDRRELTGEEITILTGLKLLGFKYIAADENGTMWAYTEIPKKDRGYWTNRGEGRTMCISYSNLFKGIADFSDEKSLVIDEILNKRNRCNE